MQDCMPFLTRCPLRCSLHSNENRPNRLPIRVLLSRRVFEEKPGNNLDDDQRLSFVILQHRNGGQSCAKNWLMSAQACTRFSMLCSIADRFLLVRKPS